MRASASGRPRTTLLVLGAGALLFFPGLGNHDLWNPNEPVFAEGAREMLLRGEWLVPHVNGQLYVDKPVLYFWAILAGSLPGGEVTAWSARLPSAAAALLTLWAVVRFGRRAFGERAALLAGLTLATMPVFVWEARFAQMDPMLTLFMFLCLACFDRARDGRAALWLAAAGAWAGLAVLTKGPVGVVLPGAAALAALALGRDPRFLLRPAWAAGAAAFAAVAVPWHVAVWAAGHGEWLRGFFLDHNVRRFTDPFDHAQPFYYFLVRFLTDLFPWSLLAAGVVASRPRGQAFGSRPWRLLAAYVAVTLLFFSASGAKRGVYVLPMYPAYALLAGRFLDLTLDGARRGLRRAAAAVPVCLAGAVMAAAGIAAPFAVHARYPEFFPAAIALGALLAGTGLTALVAALPRGDAGLARSLAALAAGLGAVYLVAALWVVPQIDSRKSARAFSERIAAQAGEAPLRSFRFWRWRSEYIFYTRRLMPVLDEPEQVADYFAGPGPAFLLVEESSRQALVEGLQVPAHLLDSEQVGGKTVYLYSNRPGGGS